MSEKQIEEIKMVFLNYVRMPYMNNWKGLGIATSTCYQCSHSKTSAFKSAKLAEKLATDGKWVKIT